MEGIVAKQWGKEEELKQLKSELAALDRKITAELKPSDAEEAARAKVVTPTKGNGEPLDEPATSQTQDSKKSMVAEPTTIYKEREPLSSRIIIGGCGVTPRRFPSRRPEIVDLEQVVIRHCLLFFLPKPFSIPCLLIQTYSVLRDTSSILAALATLPFVCLRASLTLLFCSLSLSVKSK